MSAHGGTFGRGSTGASGGRLISLAQKIFNFGGSPSSATDEGRAPELQLLTAEDLSEYRQGDVVSLDQIPVVTDGKNVRWEATPHGAVILTQTCDLVLAGRPTFHVAPIKILDEKQAKPARSGRQANFVHVPELGLLSFADLTVISTLDKTVLPQVVTKPGVLQIKDVRKFGQRVGRRFSRFAFPDEVVEWIRPLQKLVEGKDGNLFSPAGWAFDHVASLRLECEEGWKSAPYPLTLCVILKPGVVPAFEPDELPEMPQEISAWLYDSEGDIRPSPNQIAERLKSEYQSLDAISRYWLWGGLADAWAKVCAAPKGASRAVLEAIQDGRVRGDLSTSEDFSFERFRNSEELDLDHLSPTLPLHAE
ncbi:MULTISPECIES: hypothetical protein [unclassified Streptomyces]|uniref:hypothetical protein n=1 Tax=unclassified Streptomyces TaxID=2593676 RepID=UPI002ED0418A|nr:hypothetical protein OH827_13875 [Streptomyces sp. NBC_00891]WSY06032.1 hypothetical protein OG464_13875 [Streptomyces sp. NBC_00890]WSZ07656.1 hypothetical protein OG704_13875 [Streptomyces sp. NBC_00869]WSZ24845.1 hypothetical protein OG498_19690 [Streptomyces sp. NBC_00870]